MMTDEIFNKTVILKKYVKPVCSLLTMYNTMTWVWHTEFSKQKTDA